MGCGSDLQGINFRQIFRNLVSMLVNTNTCNLKVGECCTTNNMKCCATNIFHFHFCECCMFPKTYKSGSLYCMHYSFSLVLFGVMFLFHSCCWNDVHKKSYGKERGEVSGLLINPMGCTTHGLIIPTLVNTTK
jgi:hypothetical protein